MAVQDEIGVTSLRSVLMPSNPICSSISSPSANKFQMKELHSTGDDHAPKVRKPYTITKQRERWTEEDHKKFLVALKLYGRAWRQIEEHIGTKTAVQIRSHAQKFFSKVVRESESNGAGSLKSVEIPPPRPKRKRMHPYPRKSVHSSQKEISISKQLERSPSPVELISEQEDRSTSSVLSAVGLDTMGSSNGCPSPVSSAAGSNPIATLLTDQENPYPPFTSSAAEESESPSPVLTMQLDSGSKDHTSAKEDSSVEAAPTASLKLFGRTVLVTDYHRPSSNIVRSSPQCCTSSPLVGTKSIQEYLDADGQNPVRTPPRQGDFFGGPCKSAYNPWPSGTPLFFYMQMLQENLYSTYAATPLPCLAVCGNLPLPFMHSHDMNSRLTPFDSCMVSLGNQEMHKEGSWTGSTTASVTKVGIGDKNCDAVDSQSVDKKESVHFFHLKASVNSAFSVPRASSNNCAKGFTPYKRCLAEIDSQKLQMDEDERDRQRIRLCI